MPREPPRELRRNSGVSLGWTYDAFGNRTAETVSGTSSNPLPAPNITTYNPGGTLSNRVATATQDQGGFTIDNDGNVLNDGNFQYKYDANGLICAGDWMPHPTSMMQYIYDAEGNRVAKGTITTLSCNATASGFVLTNSYSSGSAGSRSAIQNAGMVSQRGNIR